MTRRLAAILAADIVGYSRLMREDEEGTLSAMKEIRRSHIDPALAARGGRIVKLMGDGMLVEFPSALDAVRAAMEIQQAISDNRRSVGITYRIGINLGDVVHEDGDIFGDGVNVSARLEAEAEPGALCIADVVYEQVRDRINSEFSDIGERTLKNISRPVRVWQWSPTLIAQERSEPLRALPDKPSIAVLPFKNLSGDPDQVYFSDGITEDIVTDLSRYNELFVIARHSSFAYRDTKKTLGEIARELGVQYILEGSIQRSAKRIRVSARLIDPDTANEIWAERYNREAVDLFDVQDEITAMIVNRLVGQIERRHHRRASSRNEDDLSTYDFILRAQRGIFAVGRDDARRAFADARHALEIDPSSARAHALVGWYFITEASNSWGMEPKEAYDKAWEAALSAMAADDNEPLAPVVLAWVYLWRDRLHDRALLELQRACELNPSNAGYRSYLAFAQIYAGAHELGKSNLEIAMQLNPHFPVLYDNHYMRALFHLRRSEEALPHAARVRSHMPQASNALALVAAIYASLGMRNDAEQVVAQIGRISPGYTREFVRTNLPYRVDADRAYFLRMLEEAGLPA